MSSVTGEGSQVTTETTGRLRAAAHRRRCSSGSGLAALRPAAPAHERRAAHGAGRSRSLCSAHSPPAWRRSCSRVLSAGLRRASRAARAAERRGTVADAQTDASVPARDVTMIGATPEEPGAPADGRDVGHRTGAAKDSGARALHARSRLDARAASAGRPDRRSRCRASQLDKSTLAGQMTRARRRRARRARSRAEDRLAGAARAQARRTLRGDRARARARRSAQGRRRTAVEQGRSAVRHRARPADRAAGRSGRRSGRAGRAGRVGEGARRRRQVLHWDGQHWTRETIESAAASREELPRAGDRRELARRTRGCWRSSPRKRLSGGAVALFRRVPDAEAAGELAAGSRSSRRRGRRSEPLALTVPRVGGSEPSPSPSRASANRPASTAQMLTVTERRCLDRRRTRGRRTGTPAARRSSSSPKAKPRWLA